jgi:phospholipid N-methyltransferase
MAQSMTAQLTFRDSLRLIKSFKTSGTITPSSPRLISRLLAPIDFASARCIVELGPGNGCVTKAILEKLHPDCLLVCFELNSTFVEQLELIADPRLRIVNACASSIREELDKLEIETIDHVVSSLPLALIDAAIVDNILCSVGNNLKTGGCFQQYQYTLKNYSDMKPRFSNVKLRFTLRNLPPAFVYECIK